MNPRKSQRLVAYVRVSRSDQRVQLQEDEIREHAARRGWELAAVYRDHGVSGSKDRRPELDRMMNDARRRRFDAVIVWRTDRLFRSLKHLVNTLGELDALGVAFTSVTEPFDTTVPSGKLLLHLVAAMGEFERSLIIERTRSGLAAAVRRGKKLGRPRLHVDIEQAHRLRGQGMSDRAIAKNMCVARATLQRALTKPITTTIE